MRFCTLAVGERHLSMANQLGAGLPAALEIYTEMPCDMKTRPGERRFDYHSKLFTIEQHYDPQGTIFFDADAICVSPDQFKLFLEVASALGPGIYSPWVFSAYGFRFPTLPQPPLDRSRLSPLMKILCGFNPLSDEELLRFLMPFEWMMLFKFESFQQKSSFFELYRSMHARLIESNCTLANECNLVGLVALRNALPVVKFQVSTGMRHKS